MTRHERSALQLWHDTDDAPAPASRVAAGTLVRLTIGTWPIEPGQSAWVEHQLSDSGGDIGTGRTAARWLRNANGNSYWTADLGPFPGGVRVHYVVHGRVGSEELRGPERTFRVGPLLHLALLWHLHQPLYQPSDATAGWDRRLPWVRLHALRDYYSMAALVAGHRDLHLTINLTPVLVQQLEDYSARRITDRMLDLTLRPAEQLREDEREEILAGFFDADWHNQIFPHQRYKELFVQRREGRPFAMEDVRDLQMWFNLAWFAQEFRDADTRLVTGETVAVRQFVEQERDFSAESIERMVEQQYKILRAIIPMHRALQERGQIEVSTTPYHHPILPLLVDSDRATIDRDGATLPPRFAYPEDAAAQVRNAVVAYRGWFDRAPAGMWPAEGAVSQFVIPFFAGEAVRWIATDRGVLARSGRWGYAVDEPDVLCQPYRAEENDSHVSVFFRDTSLSNAIGFRYHASDPMRAAAEFVNEIRQRFASRVDSEHDRILTVALDGENAWGAYPEDARPFLHALYSLLEGETDLLTVTFSEYIDGNAARGVAPHPPAEQPRVHELFTGSWIDENGSAPGVDLGTWIGETQENRAWQLLRRARSDVAAAGRRAFGRENATLALGTALESLYAAEGSDWFWWLGADQDSGNDEEFDSLFRAHVRRAYDVLRLEAPPELSRSIIARKVLWTFTAPVAAVQPEDRLVVRTHCPGILAWRLLPAGTAGETPLVPVGGVMAGIREHEVVMGPFEFELDEIRFRFRCTHPRCDGREICCRLEEHSVLIRMKGE